MNIYNHKRILRSSIAMSILIAILLMLLTSCDVAEDGDTTDPESTDPVLPSITGTLTYTDISTPVNQAATPSSPQWTGETAGQTVSYSIAHNSGDNSNDVTIDAGTGEITLTSTSTAFAGVFTVTAIGTGEYGGTITADLNIAVNTNTTTAITGILGYSPILAEYGSGVNPSNPQWINSTTPNQTVSYSIAHISGVDYSSDVVLDTSSGALTFDVGTRDTEMIGSYKVTATGTGNYTGTILSGVIEIKVIKIEVRGTLTYTDITVAVNTSDVQSPQWSGTTGTNANQTVSYAIASSGGNNNFESAISIANDGVITFTGSSSTGLEQYQITATGTGDFSGTRTATIVIRVQ